MKATELNLQKDGFRLNTHTRPARSHSSFALILGRLFPSTKSQAIKWTHFDVLNHEDVQAIEGLFNKHGFEGNYKKTKSGYWVRLQNEDDFKKALKIEFKF